MEERASENLDSAFDHSGGGRPVPHKPPLLEKLRERLKHSSPGDRQYERPMTWDEADQLVEISTGLETALWNLIFYIVNCDDEQMTPRLRQRVKEGRAAINKAKGWE